MICTNPMASKKRSFYDLINSHNSAKRQRDNLDTDQCLKDAVSSLISLPQDMDPLISEAVERVVQTESQSPVPTVDSLYFALQMEAEKSSSNISSLASTLSCARISSLLRDRSPNLHLFNKEERGLVIVIISLMKKVQLRHGVNRNSFIKAINKDNSLPLELVWRLHQAGIMTYTTYITCNLGRPNVIGGIAQSIAHICQCDPLCENLQTRKAIVGDIMAFLVAQAYNDHPVEGSTSKGMKKVSRALIDSITKKMLSDESSSPGVCIYESLITTEPQVDLAILQRYANRQITILLSHNPNLKVSDALRQQKNWTFAKTPSFLTSMYKQLLLVFTAEEIMRLVALTLEQQEVNWRTVLSFISTFLVVFTEGPQLLQDLVTSFLQKACERCEMENLILGFVLARQGAMEGPHVFPSYSDWFQKTFGSSTHSPATNKKSFGFLMKFLTDLVPYEDPAMLRTHVLRPPSVPPKCRPLLADYIILAKTRLEDLKVPVEEMGIYDEGQTTADKEKVIKQADEDVEKALSGFEKTGKVPTSVMESSIFRKPYFIGKFLPALLKSRPLPDVPDLRMKFINALHRSDKIPSSMFTSYEKNCRKESSHLLEGILSEEDESMEDLLLPPGEQFQNSLSNLAEAVIALHSQSNQKTGVAGQISILSEKITSILGSDPSAEERDGNIIDLTAPSFTKQLIEMAGLVLQTVCRVVSGLSTCKSLQGAWLGQLLAMLARHRKLWSALLYQLWVLLTQQCASLKPCHIHGLAASVLHLTSDATLSSHVTLKTANKQGPYIDLLFQSIPCHTRPWMQFSLRFYTCYMEQALRTFTDLSLYSDKPHQAVIAPHIVTQFQYLANRLVPETRLTKTASKDTESLLTEEARLCLTLYHSPQFEQLSASVSMSFADWVSKEIKVHSHDDYLSCWQRFDYSQWIIQQHIGTAYEACPSLCQKLAHAILNHDLRCEESAVRHTSCTCPGGNTSTNAPPVETRTTTPPGGTTTITPPGGDSRDHMLVLLQTLVPLLPPSETLVKQRGGGGDGDVTDAVTWLRDVWKERLEQFDTDEYSIRRHAEQVAFLRLARLLYPAFYCGRSQ